MKSMKILFCLGMLLGVFSPLQQPPRAADIGGKMEVLGGVFYGNDLQTQFSGSSELEFYLPSSRDVDLRLVLRTSMSEILPLEVKYAYLRYHSDFGHITAGRQPVSWSYGAMFNPLDYGTSLDNFAGRSMAPEVDGVRFFWSLGDRSSLQTVVSFSSIDTLTPLNELSYGARLRVPVPGHDISTQVAYSNTLLKAGATYSGDLGPAGIYAAAGYLRNTDEQTQDVVVQGGVDYSLQIGPEHEETMIYLQAEYMRFLMNNLAGEVLGTGLLQPILAGVPYPSINDLLALVATAELSYFTQAGIAMITETTDWLTVVNPFMQTELRGGLELRIDASVLRGPNGEFTYASGVQLSYYF